MPNYRKRKQSNSNNRNKNKNKNKSNTTSSSSVKQELQSEFESVGTQPNLPADVNFSCSIDTTTTTSTSVLDIEKGVVAANDSSPSSNEEIDENACDVDIDTCSSDIKTVLTQSNNSSSFCSSSCSSKKLTEIERKSKRTVFDGDSPFGNSVITDTFQAGTGINSLKTGSAFTKDAAVPTAVKSATKSIETTKISEGSVDEYRFDSGGIRNESELETKSGDRAKKVIVHGVLKESTGVDHQSGQISSKDDHSPEVIVPKIPQTITSKVVIHQISKEESPQSTGASRQAPSSKVIVHQVEESKTSHTASVKDTEQSSKVIAQHVSKKKAIRSNTSSLHSSRSFEDYIVDDSFQPISPAQQSEQSSKVIVCQTSKEDPSQLDSPKRVSFDPIPQEVSKVIVHQISPAQQSEQFSKVIVRQTSKEDPSQLDSPKRVSFDPIPQEVSKVIVHQISPAQQLEQSSKVIVRQTSKEDPSQLNSPKRVSFDPIPQEVSKVIVHQISPAQQSEQSSKVIVRQTSKEDPSQSNPPKRVSFDPIPQEVSKVIVHQISTEDSTQADTLTKENLDNTSQQPVNVIGHEILNKDSPKLTASPKRIPQELKKVIVHSISKEGLMQVDASKKANLEKIPQGTSKVIVHQISKEDVTQKASSVLPTGIVDESIKLITHKAAQESSTRGDDHSPKVIVHQTSKGTSSVISTKTTDHSRKVIGQPNLHDNLEQTSSLKPIVRQIPVDTIIQHSTSKPTEEVAQSPKVVVIPVLLESSTQTTSSPLPTCPKDTPHQNPLESSIQTATSAQIQPPVNSTKEIIIPILIEDSTQTSPTHFPTSVPTSQPNLEDNSLPPTVIFEQISRDRSTEQESLPRKHPILQDGLAQTERTPTKTTDQSNELPTPPPRTAFPVSRSPKVIVHQIHREGSAKPVFPFTPKSLEKLDHSSKRIANQILQDVSSELQSSFRAERVNRATQEVSSEPVRTSFPLSIKKTRPIRPGFFETSAYETESNPTKLKAHSYQIPNEESKVNQSVVSESKVIKQQTSNEESKLSHDGFPWNLPPHTFPLSSHKNSQETTSIDSNLQSQPLESKVIVHQISREESNLNKTAISSTTPALHSSVPDQEIRSFHTYSTSLNDQEPKVIVHQISREDSNLSPADLPPNPQYASPLSTHTNRHETILTDTSSLPRDLNSKVIVHQISREGSNLSPGDSPPNPQHETNRHETTLTDTSSLPRDLNSKVIVHQISREDSNLSPGGLPPNLHNETTLTDTSSLPRDLNSKVIVHQTSREELKSKQSTTSSVSSSLHPAREDQAIQSDSVTYSTLENLSPKVITHQVALKDVKSSHTSVPVNSASPVLVSIQTKSQELTPTSGNLESKVIVQKISRKESSSTESKSSLISSSFESETKDQQNRSDLYDLEPKVITHQTSREESTSFETDFPLNPPPGFPLSTHIQRQKTTSPSKTLESKVIVHQISRVKSNSKESRSHTTSVSSHPVGNDQQNQPHSATKLPSEILIPKGISHQILEENSNLLLNAAPSFPLSSHKKRHEPNIFDSVPKPLESRVIIHQVSHKKTKSSHQTSTQKQDQEIAPFSVAETAFPSRSPVRFVSAFPVSTEKKDQSTQFDSAAQIEPKVIVHQISSQEPKSLPSVLQDTGDQPTKVKAEPISSNESKTSTSSSVSLKKVDHDIQQSKTPSDSESKPLHILKEESELRSTTSTLTSTERKGQGTLPQSLSDNLEPKVIVHPISKEESTPPSTSPSQDKGGKPEEAIVQPISSTESTTSTPSSVPSAKLVHDIQQSKTLSDTESTHLHILQKESALGSTSPKSEEKKDLPKSQSDNLEPKLIVHPISKEETTSSSATPSSDLAPKVIDHQTSQDESISSSSSSSGESVLTAIQVKSPKSISPPVIEDQKANLKRKSVRSSFFLTSAELATQTKADQSDKSDKSDSSDTETLRGGSETSSEHEDEMSSSPELQCAKVTVHQISRESATTAPPPEVKSPKIIDHRIVREKTPPETGKTLYHPIVREIVTDKPLAYRVESPQPDRRLTIVKKSKSFDDDDIVIQEMSDNSSAGDTDNPPVISEAESETDTLEAIDDFPDTPINSRVLSVQTLPIDHEDDSTSPMSPKTAQDYKIRRQQNRAALESHFLPQFLTPLFLDSIKEENSDLSDSERRSECSDRTDHAETQQGDLEDDVFVEGGPHAKKADAVFPKSNLDFSKPHKHVHNNVRPPKTSVIREEAPPPSVVEAKIIDQGSSIDEFCSLAVADLTPQSEDAEVVYIDSASSSVSDLLELDYSEGQADETIDVRIQTPTIDLESVNEMFAYRPSESNEPLQSKTPPLQPILPPVKEEKENLSENILSPPHTDHTNTLSSEITTKIQTAVERKIPHDEIILEKIETMSETVAADAVATDRNNDDDDVAAVAAADRVQNSKANNPNSCDNAINEVVTNNDTPSAVVAVGNIENMENLREIVSAAAIQSELDVITDTDRGIMKPNFKIGEPCSDHTFKCDTRTTTTTTSSSSSSSTTTTTTTSNTTTASGTQILTLHDLSKTLSDTQHLHPLGSTSSALDRQESLDSHGSDQSQSTNQSQCTAINQGSLPHCDWNEFDTNTDTTYVSGSDTAGLASSENSSPLTTGGGDRSADDTESPPIRKLRSLCTEALASMPYGEEVLEELATVAQNIGDMPYPLPEIPHIQDIQVSLQADPQRSSVITLAQVPPTSTPAGQKFKSPPPPPVPEPPSKYDSWLGVPTESDPSVLVCLSPSQRTAVKDDSTADSLLDMHKKFVERRGYHEYTTKQVTAMNRENSHETVKLSKSASPPPPPLPPRPQQQQPSSSSSKPNGNETSTETDINADDQNNHRLLAIIRDTHESQQQQPHQQHRSENISRRTESTTNSTTTTTTNGGGDGQNEFANSPSVSKQTQEQRFASESNQSQSAHHEMQTAGQTERTIKVDREPILGLRFPTSDYFDSIFDGQNKRFSNIETVSSPGFCSQILNTQPKRYSNIETSSFESRKCVENGKVLYDVSDSNRSTVREGEKPESGELTSFPELRTKVNSSISFPYISSATPQVDRPQTGDSETIMSAFKLNTAPPPPAPPVPAQRVESSPPAPPVPPLPPTHVDTTATTTTSKTTKSTSTSESSINRNFNGETKERIFDDFRQHAKGAAAGEQSTRKKSDVFDHEKLFKDFDELSNLLKDELESGKRRPPATCDIPASISDYNRVARESKIHSSSASTTEHIRREQMKKLADEIDHTAAQRLQHRKEMRIPIRIEKPTPTPPRSAPVQMESGTQTQRTYEIPVQVEKGADTQRRTLQHQRSYDIPIRVEHQTSSRQRTRSEHQSDQRSYEAPIRVERPPEQPQRFRRAESMFNISDNTSSRHMLHDDWMKYVGDLGSSENICKPFQREVEICYMGRRPNIRAPRLSASTSDLSSTHSYDTYGAYDVRRTTTTQTPRPQQPPRRRLLSTQSMIDTTPITPCVSSQRSPVPERRSSLPREIQDQQLKYIFSKEHQLQLEFERLESERRALIDEMNRAQINQRINREAYRQRQLPPLTEDESIRQQMAEEWLNKVAEREERRLQKIIKISKINADGNLPTAPPRRVSSSDIGDEFLRRVKERRSKLHMPSDSDWESGAESQPAPRTDGNRSENEEPPATVLEGHSEADYKHLPKHLREFAKLTSQSKEEHHKETTENTSCSATKKSSVVTTVKTSSPNNTASNYQQQHQESTESLQQDAARVRDLEQLSQGKRQKLVTILRHKKPAESSSAGSCQQTVATVAARTGSVPTGSSGGGANSVKRRKQTRFLLTPNRRSWSESDLLREIDKELVLAKGFLYANGVWTPKNQTPSSSRTNLNDYQPYNTSTPTPPTSSDKISENRSSSACGLSSQKGIPTPPPPPLWTPQPERKQFRPVHFESPKLQRRYVRQQSTPSEAPPPPWSYTNSQPFPGYQSQSCTNLSQQKNKAIPWPPPTQNGGGTTASVDGFVVDDEDDGFAPTTSIAEKIRSFERSTSNSELHRPFVRHNPHEKPAILRPNEVIYSVKNEYLSEPETEYDKPKKMAQLTRRQYDGIGPTTKDGMPVVLRSEVKEPNQHEWYKRIFQTIHKQKNPDDYVTIRYKCPRGRYPYKSNGYMSEPEPNYDSDYSTVKYRTLERRRLQSTTASGTTGSGIVTGPPSAGIVGHDSQDDTVYGTMPNPVKSGQGSYKVQPGRIEDYVTGHSSVSEKEKKEWWDEVMDIFNGWLKDNDTWPRIFIEFANEVEQFQLDQQKLSPHYTEGNLSRALLKEQGYTSDSNLVFRKKDVPQHQSPLSPVEQKQVYKSVQAGGQPPLLGFRKPAPEKPKETEFEYLPITPTLTKIRVHSKDAMSKKSQTTHAAQRELICYPITNVSRPIDMFAPFPKHVPSFIPMNQPPLPPNRKSSRSRTTSMAMKISSSEVRRPTSANSSRHEACFLTKDAISPPPPKPTKYGTITLRKTVKRTEPLIRSKSAGAVVSVLSAAKEEKTKDGRVSRKQQTIRLSSCSPVRSASRVSTLRTSSRSPVAFGRSVSKERSFAEEKKRIEETMPSIRTDFTASTNILRDPKLKSPDQVKRAVRSYAYPMERSKSAPRASSPAKPAMSSYMSTYVVRRAASPPRKELRASTSVRSPLRTPVVARSKSQSTRLPSTSKPMAKTTSTVSLARTSSTFSVDSTASKVKPIPKKPLTITRPSARTETEKAKRKPVTISSSKSDSNVLRKIKESSGVKEKIVKAIPSQQKLIRTNQFFTNLFMRDSSPKHEPVHQDSVHARTRYWNTMSLPPQKTVSDSRHLSYQQCRSLSPPARPHYVEEYESVEHFHSDDEASEFGDRSGRTEDLVWQYEQRSRSEPRTARMVSDIARPESPAPVFPREFSPTREIRVPQTREMRSPSRRRIQSFRGSQRGETGKVIRASSLSSADDRTKRSIYHCDEISHSANSLEYIERHSPSCRFKNSDRFIDLNRFYSTLERVGQLERATSATSLKPIRREGEPLDFEEWRRLRYHERAERELNYLVGRLKEDQKQKDFLFRPKDVEDVKWSGNKDLALRSKDKSVEDLRENFEKKIHQEWLDESKRVELESKKDTYKPYWRGSSVVDLASSMEIKYNPDSGSFGVQKVKSETATEKPLCLSNRLISTLSKDQVSKITQQLNEIYNASEPKTKPDVTEEYVITVDKETPTNALKVRCNSSISKEELIGPVLRRKEASGKPAQSKTFDRLSREVRKFESELTETEKRRLSQTFSREIQGKARSGSPVMLARETRGAIAAENAKSTLPDIPPPPPLPKDLIEIKKPAPVKPKRKTVEEQKKKTDEEAREDSLQIETISTETLEKPEDTVSKKIQYFEERKFEEPAKIIYHAREDSSPDEDEVMRVIEENIKARAESSRFHHQEMTSSVTDLKDLFGEKESSRINFPLPRPPPPPDETIYHETKQDQHRSTSLTLSQSRDDSLENLEAIFRSRSISPQSTATSYLHRVHTGEVRKIKDKFESLGRPKKKKHFFAISPLRKVRSDPELSNDGSKDTFKTVVREHEVGDVSWITHKFEGRNSASRGRSRFRKPGSPIQRMPLRKEDRLMPHIDIISKTASLKQEMMKSRSPSPVRQQQATLHAGEVERIRCIFETSPDRESLLGQTHLGTSSPELRDISAHLTASWIAHKYPKPLDNAIRSPPPPQHEKSVSLPIKETKRQDRPYRSRSISPPKTKKSAPVTSILKPRYDFFANQKFDPSIHRPKARYVPDSGDDTGKKLPPTGTKKTSAVKFKDSDEVPPPPVPPKGVSLDSNGFSNLESPNRYFESDVNIHYKTPIRYEYKDPIPEEELAIRQAESMQKLYQEERRRKYLQELQDMNSRRHTDNFTQSQKSPIPLNRYDDFNSDLAPKSPNSSNYPKTIARALYNFQGQTARELTFKKGDVIYIRRQIDKNWYEGEHNAMIGLLPSNYVEIITKDGVRQPPKKPSEGQARAKYNFQAQSGIELSLNKGEHVTLTRRVDDNWFEGKIANRKGIFPVSYVEVLVDIGAEDKATARTPATQSIITQSSTVRPSLDTLRTNINNEFNSLTSNGQPPNGILRETRTLHKTEVLHVDTNTEPVAYRALYKYRPQNTDELELQEGDIVYVLEKCDDGWFVGTSQRSGCFGTFPGNYVERV